MMNEVECYYQRIKPKLGVFEKLQWAVVNRQVSKLAVHSEFETGSSHRTFDRIRFVRPDNRVREWFLYFLLLNQETIINNSIGIFGFN